MGSRCRFHDPKGGLRLKDLQNKPSHPAGISRFVESGLHPQRQMGYELHGSAMGNCFEQQVTEGVATYFHQVNHRHDRGIFEAVIFHEPEFPRNFRRLFAAGVVGFESTLHDVDDPDDLLCIEGILGIEQEWKDGLLETLFHTDKREMIVTSHGPIEIEAG